jgi:hypothetical protein
LEDILQSIDRRRIFSLAGATMVVLFDRSAFARDNISQYRGFTIDWSDTSVAPNFDAVEASLKHQIDIAADCGAASQVIDFFKSQDINVKAGRSMTGRWTAVSTRRAPTC